MSDPQYDTEFWFDAAGYTVLDWKGNFSSGAEAREAFDAWLSEARAEAWDYGYSAGVVDEATECTDHLNCARNPYREEPE